MNDNGERVQFETGATREPQGTRPRPDLISPFSQLALGDWLGKGAVKYGDRNWERGLPINSCLASLERHLVKFKLGMVDEPHMVAVMCNAMFIVHIQEAIRHGILPASLDNLPYYLNDKTHIVGGSEDAAE